jgi:diaminopimelate decarboxylase
MAAGVPAAACEFHGNNKSVEELLFALDSGVGKIIVDNFDELQNLQGIRAFGSTSFLLRLAPGVDPITHQKISTGQEDSKFGFNIADGSAQRALLRSLEIGLDVRGFHCHVGSQLLDPEAQRAGGEALARFAAKMKQTHGFVTEVLNVGGGLGIKYLASDVPMGMPQYCRLIADVVTEGLRGSGLQPMLVHEPGRALIGESVVTLYRVGGVKEVPVRGGTRTYVSVDGGLSDNPRPALYGAEYAVKAVEPRTEAMGTVTVAGKHCETDDLFTNISLPADIAAGDLLQVLCTGAYNASMASTYNRYPLPAAVMLRADGSTSLVQRRQTHEEMLAREIVPEGIRHD